MLSAENAGVRDRMAQWGTLRAKWLAKSQASGGFVGAAGRLREPCYELTLPRTAPAAIKISARGVATRKIDFSAANGYHRPDTALVCGSILMP